MDPMWKPYILSPENDDWIGVEDAVERKRLQNRLAQRAHRKKFGRKPGKRQKPHTLSTSEGQYLAGDKPGLTTTPRISQSRDSERGNKDSVGLDSLEVFDPFHTDGLETLHHQELDFVDERVLHPTSQPSNQFSFASSILTPLKGNLSHDSTYTINASIFDASFHPSPMIDSCFILHTMPTLFALLSNCKILGIDCPAKRKGDPMTLKIWMNPLSSGPISLLPTPLQNVVPHSPYVDLIPIPTLREKLLAAQNLVNGFELWHDLVVGVNVWGNSPWEEGTWEIEEKFAVKWWFLMGDEVLKGTNMLRSLLGKARLDMNHIKSRFVGAS